jgi:hypothetical protein
MELLMYMGNDFVESVPLNIDKISQPGYLGGFKRFLKKKYELLIREQSVQPEFVILREGLNSQ